MGKLIVIDGLYCSGKETQSKLLLERLSHNGKNVKRISYPAYNSWSSSLVQGYLPGLFQGYLPGLLGNDISRLSPYEIASSYAYDRYMDYITRWERFYEQEESIIITDRYIQSNMLYQSLTFESEPDILKFCDWVKHYERDLLELPKSDVTIFLSVKPETSQRLMKERDDNKHKGSDIYEDQIELLQKIYQRFHLIGDYCGCNIVECDELINDNRIDSISRINEIIYNIVCDKLGIETGI